MDNRHTLTRKKISSYPKSKILKFLGLSLSLFLSFKPLSLSHPNVSSSLSETTSNRCLFRLHSKDLNWSPRWWRNPQVNTFSWWSLWIDHDYHVHDSQYIADEVKWFYHHIVACMGVVWHIVVHENWHIYWGGCGLSNIMIKKSQNNGVKLAIFPLNHIFT